MRCTTLEDPDLAACRPPGLTDDQWGLLLCQIGLLQIFSKSDVKRDGNTLRYYLNGNLRAVAQTDIQNPNVPHGRFSVFYKDGKTLWITGEYQQGRPRHETWVFYLPNGHIAESTDGGYC